MISRPLLKSFAIQFAGHAALGTIAWYWLNLGVATTALVAANALIAIALLLSWSMLDAYGLGATRNWLRAIPAVALTPFMGLHVVAAIMIPLLWVLLFFPSVAAGKWKLNLAPGYVAICLAMLLTMTVLPAALLNWIPATAGFTGQAISLGTRSLLAYVIFIGAWAALLAYIGNRPTTQLST